MTYLTLLSKSGRSSKLPHPEVIVPMRFGSRTEHTEKGARDLLVDIYTSVLKDTQEELESLEIAMEKLISKGQFLALTTEA